jgi:hypothetical protein
MSRWSARLRRAASLLLGVQLLQAILLAASAVCAPGDYGVAEAVAAVPMAPASHHHGEHASHLPAHTVPPEGVHDQAPADQPSAPTHHAPAASCPMAMTCTVAAVLADVPTFATRTVVVPAFALSHDMKAPASVRPAPETPPPRG